MTNAARWIALFPVIIVVAAVPFVLAARDPLEGTRQRFAAMTPAQRKSIEQSREAYDRLSSLDQYELRQLNDELAKLDPKERAELEAVMGRLQAWVATFPDAVREKYDHAMPSERAAILKSQVDAAKSDRKTIVAEVRKAEESQKRALSADPQRPPRDRLFGLKNLQLIQRRGTEDDKALLALASKVPMFKDKALIHGCLALNIAGKPATKLGPGIRDEALSDAPWGALRGFSFVPAFQKLPIEPGTQPTSAQKAELAKALTNIYLLTPPQSPMTPRDVMSRFNLRIDPRKEEAIQLPLYLFQQLSVLKGYVEKGPIPEQDKPRVRAILGKLP